MFGLLSRSRSISETDVIKNAIFDAFLDNCLGVPSVKVDGDDDSISFTVRHFGPLCATLGHMDKFVSK